MANEKKPRKDPLQEAADKAIKKYMFRQFRTQLELTAGFGLQFCPPNEVIEALEEEIKMIKEFG